MNIYSKLLLIYFISGISILAQSSGKEQRTGTVTYRSSQNIYVKFDNTSGIQIGDTLFIIDKSSFTPAVIIKFLSSRSVAGELIIEKELKIDDKLTAV